MDPFEILKTIFVYLKDQSLTPVNSILGNEKNIAEPFY